MSSWHDMRMKDVFRMVRTCSNNFLMPDIPENWHTTLETWGHAVLTHNLLLPPEKQNQKAMEDFIYLLGIKWVVDDFIGSMGLNLGDWTYLSYYLRLVLPNLVTKFPDFNRWIAGKVVEEEKGLLKFAGAFIQDPVGALRDLIKGMVPKSGSEIMEKISPLLDEL